MRQYLSEIDSKRLIDYFNQRFGVSTSYFIDKKFWSGSRGRVYMADTELPEHPAESVAGLTIVRISAAIKPSTDFLQVLGDLVTRSHIMVDSSQAGQFIAGEDIAIDGVDVTDGYVCVRYAGNNLGCGFYRNGVVKNLISQDRRRVLEHL